MRFKLKNVLAATAVLLFVPFILLSFYNERGHREYEEGLEKRFADLRDRLQYAEALNRQREDDLFTLRSQFNLFINSLAKNVSAGAQYLDQYLPGLGSYLQNYSQAANGGVQLPGIYTYLPHLVGRPNSLQPAHSLSQGRHGVSIVIGIPTVKRDSVSYVAQTIDSLITGMTAEERNDCLIVVFVAEPFNEEFSLFVMEQLQRGFPEATASGLLEVIVPPAGFYPNLDNLRETFGDTQQRVKWRTKQNLDYSYLMLYARSRGVYYVQLEDDVVSKPGFLTVMKSFAYQQKSNDWLLLEFSTLGFIGKMFKSADLPFVVEFFLMFYADKPIDWLLDHLLWVKVCNPEKDQKHCNRMKQAVRRRFKPSLFQHIGVKSSLRGKVQKLKDRDFGKNGLARAHMNPVAQLSTTLKTYGKYTLLKAYTGETFFWAITPNAGDIIDFKFNPPIPIEKFLFRTGNPEHPDDMLHEATVQVQPELWPSGPVAGLPILQDSVEGLAPGFLIVGHFNSNGLAEGVLPPSLARVAVVRIQVITKSPNWVIFSEVLIQKRQEEAEQASPQR
ncbi:alpha-1,3-mannosyl-glycoprotein 4-beta-N-acetylglucosaminyltransferase A-like isoform X2 [Babylonia areolata]